MDIFKSVLIEPCDNKIIFSGYYLGKFFFGTKDKNKIEIINDYLFYDFQVKYITNHIEEKIRLKIN